jgi:hypothetical protein
MTEELDTLTKKWLEFIMYMNIWAYGILQRESIIDDRIQSEMNFYDDDGNLVEGISDTDKETVLLMCRMRKMLVKDLVSVSPADEVVTLIMEKLEVLKVVTRIILEHKQDELEKLFDTTK